MKIYPKSHKLIFQRDFRESTKSMLGYTFATIKRGSQLIVTWFDQIRDIWKQISDLSPNEKREFNLKQEIVASASIQNWFCV